jgi:hypothetical protein
VAPTELNTIFNVANKWLKPKALVGGGYVSTYAMKADHIENRKEESKKGKNTCKGKEQINEEQNKTHKVKERAGNNGKRSLSTSSAGMSITPVTAPRRKRVVKIKNLGRTCEANVFHMT